MTQQKSSWNFSDFFTVKSFKMPPVPITEIKETKSFPKVNTLKKLSKHNKISFNIKKHHSSNFRGK